MFRKAAAALLLLGSMPAAAQQPPVVADLSYAMPIAGSWSYRATSDGSEATFYTGGSLAQVTLHCTRATRMISIAKAATAAAPFLGIWTSSGSRSLPAGFTPATARLTATISAFDPLLDNLAFSRGRVGFAVAGTPTLVVPSWAEIGRVVEDCRT